MEIQETEFTLEAPDGHRIHGFTWSSQRTPRGKVQIVHGRGEHSGRYRHLAHALVRAGYLVHAADHRGHGAAAHREGRLGDFGPRGFAALVDDLALVTRHLRGLHPRLALVMFAHSMGSFAAQYFLPEHSALVDGLMLSGTAALDLRDPKRSGARATDFNAGIANPRTPYDWLSRDPAVVDAYIADPLCGFTPDPAATASMYAGAQRIAQRDAYAKVRRELPLALMTGDRDPVNDFLAWFTPLADRLRSFGFTDVSTYVYGGARHEPVNETNRAEVITNLIAWVDRVVATAGEAG